MAGQWDYCRLYIASIVTPYPVVSSTSPNLRGNSRVQVGTSLDDALAALADDNWELMGALTAGTNAHLLFKKPM
jgi:hypothetical protein